MKQNSQTIKSGANIKKNNLSLANTGSHTRIEFRFVCQMLTRNASLDVCYINYSRLMPVFIRDMPALPGNTQIFEEFMKGNFTIRRSNRKFSALAEDQAHEQNNKIVKVDGGAIGILDQAQALWMFYVLELSELWIEFGAGKDKKWMPIHRYANNLGEEKCQALFFCSHLPLVILFLSLLGEQKNCLEDLAVISRCD